MLSKSIVTSILLLSCAAVSAQGPRAMRGVLQDADSNQDGQITREEFAAARAQQFSRLDKNSDGFIVAEELPKRMTQHDVGMQADSDGDGKIGKEEFSNARTPVFDAADSDGNSVLDAKELEAARSNVRERVRERRQRQ